MARSRNIKPGFFSNDSLAELPALTRLLFIGLWTICDRDGRLEDRPRKIKAEALPYDECNVDAALQALHNSGFILRYTSGGLRCIQVVNWAKHQNPHMKEAESTIPAPDKHQTSTVLAPEQAPDEQQPKPERAGLIPDSLNLIPDSLGTTLSGKPDPAPKKPDRKPEALDVLAFLNEKTGRSYQPVDVNIEFISARLNDGATVDEIKDVIERKCAQWLGDRDMEQYLRPATLFNRTKFAQYQGETGTARAERRAVV